jgi:RNA polymerase sigma-70 factor (ECF subfamily)
LPPAEVRSPRSPCPATAAKSDAELVLGLRQGDEGCFNALYERYFDRVYNFAYLRVRNHADAEEIAQETFTAVFRSIGAFRGSSSLLSWVYGIAKNTTNNHLRRARLRQTWHEQAERELLHPSNGLSTCNPEESLSLRRYADAVAERLSSVASWQAEVFVLRHLENLPIQEISRRTRRSSDAVRSSLYRVKRMLIQAGEEGHRAQTGP